MVPVEYIRAGRDESILKDREISAFGNESPTEYVRVLNLSLMPEVIDVGQVDRSVRFAGDSGVSDGLSSVAGSDGDDILLVWPQKSRILAGLFVGIPDVSFIILLNCGI